MTGNGAIVCCGLRKTYTNASARAQTVALDDFSLDIAPQEFVAILGPSGCGKSTLLNIMAGFEQPSAGTILQDGEAIDGPSPQRGVVFQEYGLFPWMNVLDNVAYGLRERRYSRSEAASFAQYHLKTVGLQGFEWRYPHELSGGMRQRVALARVLAIDPAVLLMDEPFAAVDIQTRTILQDQLQQIWSQSRKTVVFVTHGVDEAIYLADRIVVMTARPGMVKAIIPVELVRPRDRLSSAFNEYRRDITLTIESEARKAFEVGELERVY